VESLKLGLVGLSEAEVRLMSTLFRLHRVEPSFIWTLAAAGPFDALLVDETADPVAFAAAKGARTQVKRLGAIHAVATEDLMPRPIRSDHLMEWLSKIEVVILHQGQDAFSSTQSHSRESHAAATTLPAKEMPAAPDPMAAPAADLDALCFKLKRWPSEALHKRDSVTIRMASMLTRRPMTIAALSEASGQPVLACRALVQMLRVQNLLTETHPPAAIPEQVTERSAKAVPAEAHKPRLQQQPQRKSRFGGGLIKSIRQRLGIA
jgi:hypothetical protein